MSAKRRHGISAIIENHGGRRQRRRRGRVLLEDVLTELQRLCGGEEIPLDRAVLLIARSEYPDLDHARYLAELDRLSGVTRRRLPPSRDPLEILQALNHVLIDEEGYRGNQEDYYDPRNSFLNDVIDRKLGIPITLSVLYLEVARRLAFPLAGVSFPGHFLVRHRSEERDFFVDPFHRGEILTPGELPGRLADLFGPENAAEILKKNGNRLPEEYVTPAGPRDILLRMLTNLREIYLRRRDLGRGRHVVAMMLALHPDSEQVLSSLAAIRKIEASLN
ncbi:MAG TPA: transglutaminase-like domain-containing protein [Candidatus Polarisedimenticolia bacterium]|nr:transglutaminase-like domain-containing protein [Candidatus Polarisedimenticolia bacterium]